MSILILGCGAWGTTIAKCISENNHDVTLWCHRESYCDAINTHHENSLKLPNIKLNKSIKASLQLEDSIVSASSIIIALPSTHIDTVESALKQHANGKPILILTKGVKITDSGYEFLSEVFARWCPKSSIAVLSGPNIAIEIAQNKPAATVIASTEIDTASRFQSLIATRYFRVYTSTDCDTVQLGGVYKNIIAIAAGITDVLKFGQNANAALITRGLAEMKRYAIALNLNPTPLYGLSGLGDLVTTCNSPHSRNRKYGQNIVLKNPDFSETCEGVQAVKILAESNKTNLADYPFLENIYNLIYKEASIETCLENIMNRTLKEE